mmetsp:Transcript_9967/g.22449  ORF Transcript_9967/g.22449 Transcript_9967/m.22449 type:complete len:98 (+) Transcript_9967:136-429(+)
MACPQLRGWSMPKASFIDGFGLRVNISEAVFLRTTGTLMMQKTTQQLLHVLLVRQGVKYMFVPNFVDFDAGHQRDTRVFTYHDQEAQVFSNCALHSV